jgi:hypothetical protein
MDRLVDQAVGPGAAHNSGTTPDEAHIEEAEIDATEDGDSQDIESELYCSTREAGIAAVGFGPLPDS